MKDNPTVADWGGASRFADLDGPVHYVDFGGPPAGPRLVLVHGLGGSHLNWSLLAPRLATRARVLAVDLLGFGLSHPQGRATTVQANAKLVGRFVDEVAGSPVILVGNSMGALASIMLAVRRPDAVAGLVLIDPALPLARGVRPDVAVAAVFARFAVPLVGRYALAKGRRKMSAQEQVRQLLALCCVDPAKVPGELVEASVGLVEQRARVPGLDAAFLAAARSLLVLNARPDRAWAMLDAVRQPVLLLHGTKDRLVPVGSARVAAARNPAWTVELIPDVGHVPQLEVPELTADRIGAWLDGPGAPAARRAGTSGRFGRSPYPEGSTPE
ncbi:pimeloyl-ACP methyl ester carboxylesterase [Kribbella voronezhensis]|uniref:Pimeloyl-ACP methyl ester carboxylesterase n=1 Tax=Kribbella voronezhensis TaxID=2512212 RepID=A0A4R7SWL9_9ACTN|nr:alpha/beta fold hydrolase [Kribbella voronezhensis]TDU83750.1 pimeloyl-ACP methyl ester carboxylesterase [Kribbella voronezhensis]